MTSTLKCLLYGSFDNSGYRPANGDDKLEADHRKDPEVRRPSRSSMKISTFWTRRDLGLRIIRG